MAMYPVQQAQAAQIAFAVALGCIGFIPNVQQETMAYMGCNSVAVLGILTPDEKNHYV
jgi:hypothetical protein